MRKWMTWSLALALTTALWGTQEARAQDDVPPPETPAFVDEDGDGIADQARRKHRRGRRGGMRAKSQIAAQLTEEQQADLVEFLKALTSPQFVQK